MSRGRGPTRLISPRKTLSSVGSSSSESARIFFPNSERRSPSWEASVFSGAVAIERNLSNSNGLQSRPGRF